MRGFALNPPLMLGLALFTTGVAGFVVPPSVVYGALGFLFVLVLSMGGWFLREIYKKLDCLSKTQVDQINMTAAYQVAAAGNRLETGNEISSLSGEIGDLKTCFHAQQDRLGRGAARMKKIEDRVEVIYARIEENTGDDHDFHIKVLAKIAEIEVRVAEIKTALSVGGGEE